MMASNKKLSPGAAKAADLVRNLTSNEVYPELLIEKLNVEKWQAITLLKELAGAGYGTFVLGRRGGATRLEKAENSSASKQLPNSTLANETPDSLVECQVFLLKRIPPFQVKVPADITQDEAEKLGKWLLLIADGPS